MKSVRVEFNKIKEWESHYVDDKGETHLLPRKPTRKRTTDAGYDVYAAEDGTILPGESRNFHTGVRVAVPPGWFYSVRGRSGLGFKNVQPFIGTIDATYNGELLILLMNTGNEAHTVHKGDRIAQVIFEEQIHAEFVEVDEFSAEYNQRGKAGFGSSGN
jgi:dUTP pyrophosphatase